MLKAAHVTEDDTDLLREPAYKALARVLATNDFQASPQLAAFLTFVVGRTLDGEGHLLKAYTVATEVLGRPASFDPQSDPIVRVEATRLRRLLDHYYATEGQNDRLRIQIPRGGYRAEFVPLQPSAADRAGVEPFAERIEDSPAVSAVIPPQVAKKWAFPEFTVSGQWGWAALLVVSLGVASWSWGLLDRHVQTSDPVSAPPQIYSLTDPKAEMNLATMSTGAISVTDENAPLRFGAIRMGTITDLPKAAAMAFEAALSEGLSRYDGITAYEPGSPPPAMGDDLYVINGRYGEGRDEVVPSLVLRLVHAASSRIVWSRSFATNASAGASEALVEAIVPDIAGPGGALRTDMVGLTLEAPAEKQSHHFGKLCLAKVEIAERAALAPLLTEARACLDQALQETPYQPLLLVRSARLRLEGDASERAVAAQQVRLALALSPGNRDAKAMSVALDAATDPH